MIDRVVTISAALLLAAAGCGGDDEPTTYTSPDGAFSVMFPGEPDQRNESTTIAGYDLDLEFHMYDDDDGAYMVNQHDYTPLAAEAGLSEAELAAIVDLDGAVEGAMVNMGATADSVETTTVEGRDARRVEFSGTRQGQDFTGAAYLMADGPVLYQVMAMGTADHDDLQRFVESFDFLTERQEIGG